MKADHEIEYKGGKIYDRHLMGRFAQYKPDQRYNLVNRINHNSHEDMAILHAWTAYLRSVGEPFVVKRYPSQSTKRPGDLLVLWKRRKAVDAP